jgi:hypothetical protein
MRKLSTFGRRGLTDRSAIGFEQVPAVPFARRNLRGDPPALGEGGGFASQAQRRLGAIARELSELFGVATARGGFIYVTAQDPPTLVLGDFASVSIDRIRSTYILAVTMPDASYRVETASEECLMDHIVSHMAVGQSRSASPTLHGLVSGLVGFTLAEIERSLIISTLRHVHFNRTAAAEVLGLSVRTIRNKIKSFRNDAEPV